MSIPDREAVELFLQEASEHLQYLREYVSVLQEIQPRREDLERLYIAAHTLSGTSASYGFPRFSEIAGKLAHVFQYSLNATLGDDLHGPLTEFLSDGISLLETDLLEISDAALQVINLGDRVLRADHVHGRGCEGRPRARLPAAVRPGIKTRKENRDDEDEQKKSFHAKT